MLIGLAETAAGAWVFPGRGEDEPLNKHDLYGFWLKARDAAGIVADARLHDLRDAHASHAVRLATRRAVARSIVVAGDGTAACRVAQM